jgi:lipoprotein-anchoring transpeptidase ErfK/SrfK
MKNLPHTTLNNPVGSVWIGISSPGYGIHGTPDLQSARRQLRDD